MQNIDSRNRFIEEVVRTIAKSGNDDSGAFIFGISGRWGEGKTFFLSELRQRIEQNKQPKMAVIELNPWKYAQADDSILRELLRQVVALHTNRYKRLLLKHKLEDLYHDVSKKQISWLNTLFATLLFILLGLLYKSPPHFLVDLRNTVSHNKAVFTLLLIPILSGLANSITTSQTSTKAISTRDKFDELLKKLLKDINVDKVVVYVDDLDRLTALKALSVLDSLRTFFDKEKLIFIVASDHTVLERHLGNELIPHAAYPEQIEEGRRFLKKIFNVYWRLPLPTKPEYENYIDGLVGTTKDSFIYKKLKNDNFRKLFKTYLLDYFSNNFRNVQRFIGRVEFTFSLIEAQYEADSTSKKNKEYFGEMLNNPVLVIRVLLIEELANPLFEKIQHTPELLLRLEKLVSDGNFDQAIEEITKEGDESYLSSEQLKFLKSFIPQKPRFKDEAGVQVKSIEPYIFLSSDSSFGDIRGLSPEEFISYIDRDAFNELKDILHRSSEKKLQESVDNFIQSFSGQALDVRQRHLSSLISATSLIEPDFPAKKIITDSLSSLDYTFLDQYTPEERLELINRIGQIEFDDTQLSGLITAIPALNQADFEIVNNMESLTNLTQYKFLKYFETYFPNSPGDAISRLGSNIAKFSPKIIKNSLTSLFPQLIAFFISDNNDARRAYELPIIKMLDEGNETLKEALKNQIRAKDRAIMNWLISDARNSSEPIFTFNELVQAVFSNTSESVTSTDLLERFSMFESLPEAKETIWQKLLTYDDSILHPALFDTIMTSNYLPLAPSDESANKLLQRLIKRLVRQDMINDAETINWMSRISRNKWIFNSMSLSGTSRHLINEKLNTQYLTDEIRAHLERIKNEFQ